MRPEEPYIDSCRRLVEEQYAHTDSPPATIKGMEPNRYELPKFGRWAILLLALSLVTILAYGMAYVHLSETGVVSSTSRVRGYEAEWMEWVFAPGARVESLVTGDDVVVGRFHKSK